MLLSKLQGALYCQFNPVLTEPNILTLTGCLGQGDYQLKFAVPSAEYLIKNIILYQLEQLNIHYTGKSIKAIKLLPKNSILLTSHDSASLATLVRHMMTISDNLYAQTLIRRLGYQLYQRGTFAAGKKAVLEILSKQLGLDDTHIQFEDGAGLSENDLLTANYLVNLLYYMQNKSSFSSFYNALPVAGESGTLVKRFSNKLKGKVVAKTGSLSTVLTLSGYLTLNTGKKYIFSILINGLLNEQQSNAIDFQQDLLTYLYHHLDAR